VVQVAEFAVESYARFGMSLKPEQVQNIRELAKMKLVEAIRAKGKNPADYTITDIMPGADLGLANEEWKHTFTNAYTEEDFVNKTLEDEKFIVIYGYTNLSPDPKTLYFKFYKGASVEKVVHVQGIYAQEEPYAYFDPQVWSEGDKMRIVLYGKAAGDDYPVFLGFVAQPKGERITK
jgi:hypothetical protein